jgi:hypothetical protein
MIGRCLGKIKREKSTLTLIAPTWNTQPWYPDLLDLLCDDPILLPPIKGLLTDPRGQEHPLIMNRSLHLEAWKVSGDERKQLDFRVRRLLENSRRASTRAVYKGPCSKWVCWCESRAANPLQAPVDLIVNFLSEKRTEGLGYNSLNVYRSAIAAQHQGFGDCTAGQHPLVKRLLAGVYNECPPAPKYTSTWDVQQVLDHLEQLGPNKLLDNTQLTHKLAMLLAFTSAGRASDLQALDLEYMADDRVTFTLVGLTKTSRFWRQRPTITIKAFTDRPRLDPVTCLRHYIERHHGERRSTNTNCWESWPHTTWWPPPPSRTGSRKRLQLTCVKSLCVNFHHWTFLFAILKIPSELSSVKKLTT